MNRKHLLWHVFNSFEPNVIEFLIDELKFNETSFSDNPQSGEITVSESLSNSYEAYKKSLQNG